MKDRILFPYSKSEWPKFVRAKHKSIIGYFKINKKPRGSAYKRLAGLEDMK